ncbi:YbaB/EbfC family nucleoid-associated protein [Nocardia miyunensis]|uniref:YbaB/EbfC family nucleoid-associated protein n=1 Tax=Nocardia miyunensis TaxID=282684 RepID=UPI000A4C5B87|nr:YbaB/EbfC family nucleoid-associated protein [Nocardia miyunensis]
MSDESTDRSLEQFRSDLSEITRLQQERTLLTGAGTAERRRVTVTVNADGIAIDIKFSSDISDLDYDEISAAITQASLQAVTDVAKQTNALFAPISIDPGDRARSNETAQAFAELREQLD